MNEEPRHTDNVSRSFDRMCAAFDRVHGCRWVRCSLHVVCWRLSTERNPNGEQRNLESSLRYYLLYQQQYKRECGTETLELTSKGFLGENDVM